MPKFFINPNLHVILIHYPLGVLVLGVVIELFSFLWWNSAVRIAARWMIVLGALATLPALMSGIYALYQVTGDGSYPLGERYVMLSRHVWLQSIATFLAVFVVVVGLGASDAGRQRLARPLLACLLLVLGLMAVGAWFGGETIYQQGTAVQVAPDHGAAGKVTTPHQGIYYYIGDPLQIHMILFSGVLVFAAVGLGMARRKTSVARAAMEQPTAAPDAYGEVPIFEVASPSLAATGEVAAVTMVARFWLFAALFTILTAAAGWWFWSNDSGSYSLRAFWADLMTAGGEGAQRLVWTRQSIHVWVGISLVLLTLILACVGRWAGRSRFVLGLFGIVLVLLVAAQFWLGTLLAFSGTEGPVYRFDNKEHTQAE